MNPLCYLRPKISHLLQRVIMPFAPARARLPFRFTLARIAGDGEGEIFRLRELIREGKMAIDVGANAGLYTYALSRLGLKVVAFEPNREIAKDLIAHRSKSVEVRHEAVSSQNGTAKLYLPIKNRTAMDGWASLIPGNLADSDEVVEIDVPVTTIDALEYKDVAFIKIDVEGLEYKVLEGATKTVSKWRPNILIEIRSINQDAIADWAKKLGYRLVKPGHETTAGKILSPGNYLLVSERTDLT